MESDGSMFLVSVTTVQAYAEQHAAAREALGQWVAIVRATSWRTPQEVVALFPGRVRPIRNRRLVFDIKGHDYRMVCSVRYASPDKSLNGIVRIEFFRTHAEYDKIDATTVTWSGR